MKPLRILMVAPQPFLRPRGTPFSVFHRIRSLTGFGHRVDLVTYPFGEDVQMEGLRIFRASRPWGVGDVPIGPSINKLLLDGPVVRLAWKMAHGGDYDLIHTHEEAGALGGLLRRRLGIPHLYDMHSSLPQQFENFGRFNWRPVVSIFERMERSTLGGADGVIAICQALEDRARAVGYDGPLAMIENTLDFAPGPDIQARLPELREKLELGDGPVAVYTGTLERYQGMDLLIEAAAVVAARDSAVRIVIVGGTEEASRELGERARALGAGEVVRTVPAVSPQDVHLYLRLADMLVTTRTYGTNTPLKLYQYLKSGRPMVATAIFSHTQVLDDDCAELVEPESEAIAEGILRLARDEERRASLVAGAERISRERYSDELYHAKLNGLLEQILQGASSRPVAVG